MSAFKGGTKKLGDVGPEGTETTTSEQIQRLAPPTIDDSLEVYCPTEEETSLVDKLSKEGEFKHLAPGKIIRFLRARKLKEDKAKAMLRNHITWFSRVKPLDLVLTDINKKAVDSAFWRYLGDSKEGCPILEVRIGLWSPGDYSLEEYENYIAFFCTMLERQMETHTQYIIIVNLAKWTLRHGNYLSYIKAMIDIAQNQLPDRLRRVMLFKTPFIFRASWGMIKPWLDPITAEKVEFVRTAKRDEVLRACQIDKGLLPERYGGTINEEDEKNLPVPGFTTPMN